MERKKARDLGIKLGSMKTGETNAITDIDGVGVGHSNIIEGDDIRTGVTAIVPHQENPYTNKVVGAVDIYNAYGKSTGLPQIIYQGVIETPIMLTETLNTWRVSDAVLDYFKEGYDYIPRSINPVVGETNGGFLTNNFERTVGKNEVFEAIDYARSAKGQGPVEEGNVGGGTPMSGYGFKGGIGTSSRVIGEIKVGAMVQLNCGRKEDLRIGSLPIGRELDAPETGPKSGNSIMMIVATNLDLDSRQLWKVAKRAALGLARTGSYSGNGSGDFTIAFTTSDKRIDLLDTIPELNIPPLGDSFLNPIYRATVEATEEAIINALFKAETMTGRDGNTRYGLPLNQVKSIFESHGYLK